MICDDTNEVISEEKDGYHRFKFSNWLVFEQGASKHGSTAGKLFAIRLLEEMYKLGYDPIISSDLVRCFDNATIFFQKVSAERPACRVYCMAPGRSDTEFTRITKDAIIESWPRGIQNEDTKTVSSETIEDIKLHGNPWYDVWSEGEDNYRCRQMIVTLMTRLGQHGFKFIAGINLKTTDTFFFFKDPNYRVPDNNFSCVSLNYSDRLRLINCPEMVQPVADTIMRNGNEIQRQRAEHDGYEFKIVGYHWHCSGEEAVASRRLICRIAETFLTNGWALSGALDLSRRPDDKSILMFTRAVPYTTKFGCVSLSNTDKLRLLDFGPDTPLAIVNIIKEQWLVGIQEEKMRDDGCYQIKVEGNPWGWQGGDSKLARSMMCHVLKELKARDWQLVASADVSSKYVHQKNGPDFPIDVHSWFLVYWPAGTNTL